MVIWKKLEVFNLYIKETSPCGGKQFNPTRYYTVGPINI